MITIDNKLLSAIRSTSIHSRMEKSISAVRGISSRFNCFIRMCCMFRISFDRISLKILVIQ